VTIGGDQNYDVQITNVAVARLRILQPTEVIVSITMRDGNCGA